MTSCPIAKLMATQTTPAISEWIVSFFGSFVGSFVFGQNRLVLDLRNYICFSVIYWGPQLMVPFYIFQVLVFVAVPLLLSILESVCILV